jgi:hypothetical protein
VQAAGLAGRRVLVLPHLVRTAPVARLSPRRMCLAGIAHLAQARPGRGFLESCEAHRAVLAVTSKLRLGLTPVLRDVLWNLDGAFSQGLGDGTTVILRQLSRRARTGRSVHRPRVTKPRALGRAHEDRALSYDCARRDRHDQPQASVLFHRAPGIPVEAVRPGADVAADPMGGLPDDPPPVQ